MSIIDAQETGGTPYAHVLILAGTKESRTWFHKQRAARPDRVGVTGSSRI